MCKLGGCRCIHGASVILELFQVVQDLLVLGSLVPNQFHHPDGKEVALGKTCPADSMEMSEVWKGYICCFLAICLNHVGSKVRPWFRRSCPASSTSGQYRLS